MFPSLSLAETARYLSLTPHRLSRLLEKGVLTSHPGADGPRIYLSQVKAYEGKRARARVKLHQSFSSSAELEKAAVEELAHLL